MEIDQKRYLLYGDIRTLSTTSFLLVTISPLNNNMILKRKGKREMASGGENEEEGQRNKMRRAEIKKRERKQRRRTEDTESLWKKKACWKRGTQLQENKRTREERQEIKLGGG